MIDQDMTGRICVITGANTGIGKATAHALAARGSRVILACRNEVAGAQAVADIIDATGNSNVELHPLDLADLANVRASADALLARGLAIDILINNAGLAGKRDVTADGFEITLGVNHLGHVLWTDRLRNAIVRAAPSRIIVVSSRAHYDTPAHKLMAALDSNTVRRKTQSLTGIHEYRVSKLANVIHARALAKEWASDGVTAISLHPGVVATDVWRHVPWPIRPVLTRWLLTPEQGARTSIHCATMPQIDEHTGAYFSSSMPRKPNKAVFDDVFIDQVMARSRELVSDS